MNDLEQQYAFIDEALFSLICKDIDINSVLKKQFNKCDVEVSSFWELKPYTQIQYYCTGSDIIDNINGPAIIDFLTYSPR